MTNEPLGDRQGQILVAIVREYIRSADPVGSKHLVGKFNLPVSSATVRSEMARLEELGYLTQPHTSAGRVPTDRGYRFFVDNEIPARLGPQQRRDLEQVLAGDPADLEELLRRANEILSRTTHLAAAALTPRLKESRLKHLDLAWVGPRRAVLVVIADGGRVEKRIVETDTDVSEEDLERIEGELNRTLSGKGFADAIAAGRALVGSEPADAARDALATVVAEALAGYLEEDQDVIVGGAANLATTQAFGDIGDFARVFEVFERRMPLQQALADPTPPASVRIGGELPLEDLQSCSLVVAPYSTGAIGVIGPMRMEYPRVIAAVSLMAQLLGDRMQDLE